MEKLKLVALVVVGLVVVYFLARTIIEPSFEKLDRNAVDIPDYVYSDPSQKGISEAYQNSGIDFREIYPTDNRFLLYYYDDNYWIFWTGVVDLDDGLKFIYTPKYSRLIVTDRNTNEIISSKLFLRDVTNAKIIDGYVYFVYASFANYKLGRYKLNE
ncbi:MAG: hypothetical protein FH748_13150 [Balneolaceae bacterium]|nr:hypothetical protein [Balneolaceae bacterium]